MEPISQSGSKLVQPRAFPVWLSQDPYINLREIAPQIYVGAEKSPFACKQWTLIVDLCGTSDKNGARKHTEALLYRPMSDGSQFDKNVLNEVLLHVSRCRARGPVLIHCHAGLSRSVSAAYAVLRRLEGMSHERALRRVKAHPMFPMQDTLASARKWVHTGRS